MIGAVLGDMAGTPLEDGSYKTRDDDLFLEDYSDVSLDSVMAMAVAEALLNTKVHAASWEIRSAVFGRCEKWWKGYAASEDKAVFFTWLIDDDTATERTGCVSWVSAVGWLFYDVNKVREAAWAAAEALHFSPVEVRDAEALACAIYYARIGYPEMMIQQKLAMDFSVRAPRYVELLRLKDIGSAEYQPLMEALACVFAAKDFEGALRNVLRLHGDISPVITIAGALAEAYFGIPEGLKARGLQLVPDDLLNVIGRFSEITKGSRSDGKKTADMLAGTGMIRLACSFFKEHYDEKETFYRLMGVIRDRMYQNGMLLVPYEGDMTKQDSFNLLTMDHGEEHWLACFTSEEECEKGPKTSAVTIGIDTIFDMIQHEDGIAGVTINPFSDNINVTKEGAWNILTERVTE